MLYRALFVRIRRSRFTDLIMNVEASPWIFSAY